MGRQNFRVQTPVSFPNGAAFREKGETAQPFRG